MSYTEPLKIGAVYQSASVPYLSRRITRMRGDAVEYVLHDKRSGTTPRCVISDSLFRDFTAHEIPPSEL